jgi:hypothetical protein
MDLRLSSITTAARLPKKANYGESLGRRVMGLKHHCVVAKIAKLLKKTNLVKTWDVK